MSPHPKSKIAHLILAAGSSSRMGEPKQLLPWEDTTLISHSIQQSLKLENVSTNVILGAYYDVIYKEINNFPIRIVKNVDWQSGMGSAIRCGIKTIQQDSLSYDGALISLVDQPLLGVTHFNLLINQFENDVNSIAATDLDDGKGVPAVISAVYFDELIELEEDYGARYIIKRYIDKVKTVPAINKGIDIDTVAQYQALVKNSSSF